MKPFNLEAAKRGEPVIQRCGRPVRILTFDSKVCYLGVKYPLVVEFLNGSGEFEINSLTEDGEITPAIQSDVDLFMAPRKEKRWIVSYLTKNGTLLAIGCDSRDEMTLRKSICEHEGVVTNIQVTEIEVEP